MALDMGKPAYLRLNRVASMAVDGELSREAGVLHSEVRGARRDFGLAEAYVLAVARRSGSKILTGDPILGALRGWL